MGSQLLPVLRQEHSLSGQALSLLWRTTSLIEEDRLSRNGTFDIAGRAGGGVEPA